jgi:hypothetical protein
VDDESVSIEISVELLDDEVDELSTETLMSTWDELLAEVIVSDTEPSKMGTGSPFMITWTSSELELAAFLPGSVLSWFGSVVISTLENASPVLGEAVVSTCTSVDWVLALLFEVAPCWAEIASTGMPMPASTPTPIQPIRFRGVSGRKMDCLEVLRARR